MRGLWVLALVATIGCTAELPEINYHPSPRAIRVNHETLIFSSRGELSRTTSGLIAPNSTLMGLDTIIVNEGDGCRTVSVGTEARPNIYARDVFVRAGTTTTNADATEYYSSPSPTDVTVTGESECFGLSIRVKAWYQPMPMPIPDLVILHGDPAPVGPEPDAVISHPGIKFVEED